MGIVRKKDDDMCKLQSSLACSPSEYRSASGPTAVSDPDSDLAPYNESKQFYGEWLTTFVCIRLQASGDRTRRTVSECAAKGAKLSLAFLTEGRCNDGASARVQGCIDTRILSTRWMQLSEYPVGWKPTFQLPS